MNRFKLLALVAALAVPLAACDEGDGVVEVISGSIQGSVTVDGTGASGVTVTLSGADSRTTTTGASGNYNFADVPAGSYVVSISGTPSDASFPQTAKTAVISSEGQTVNVSFAGMAITTSAITGTVTAGGSALSGVTVTLSGAASRTTTTGADGSYSFGALPAGSYTVSISGFAAEDYTFDATSKTASVATGETAVVSFSGTEAETASITATVTVDGEPRSGITVTLAGPEDGSGVTNASGQVNFPGLPRGSYSIAITNPDPANISFDRTVASVSITEIGGSASVAFVGSTVAEATISGRVFLDSNNNNQFDEGEGMNAVAVSLSGDASNSTETDANGNFAFGGLTAGDYTVTITNPDPSALSFPGGTSRDFTLSATQNASTNFRAVERRDGRIFGTVFFDNGDGVLTSADEVVTGAEVRITGPESRTAFTDGSGQYSFDALLLGEYEVSCVSCDDSFVVQFGSTVTLTAEDPDQQRNILSTSGGAGSISGQLFIDGNESGTFEAAIDPDLELGGVEITAEGPNVGTIHTTFTAGDGSYSFSDLPGGTYNVTVADVSEEPLASAGVTLLTSRTVQRTISTGGSATANYGYRFDNIVVRVQAVQGSDGGNESPVAGVEVTLWGNQNLTNALAVGTTGPDGFVSLGFDVADESSIPGPRDYIVFSEVTGTGNGDLAASDDAVIEYRVDPGQQLQTIGEDHNLLWTRVFLTAQYVEQDGTPVSDAVVAAVGAQAELGHDTNSDPTAGRTGNVLIDTPGDDDVDSSSDGQIAFDAAAMPDDAPEPAEGQAVFYVDFAAEGIAAAGTWLSVQDISGSDQIEVDGEVAGFVQAFVDNQQRVVDLGDLVISYPLPDITFRLWHETDDVAGFDEDGDDFTQITQVNAFYNVDEDEDGDLDGSVPCAVSFTGDITCTDVPIDNAELRIEAKTDNPNFRLITEGGLTVDVMRNEDGTEAWVDLTGVVTDLRFSHDLGDDQPFGYKTEANTVRVTVFNEGGHIIEADGVLDGNEVGVEGLQITLAVENSLGTFVDEFPKTATTTAAGRATFSDMLEGEYAITITGAPGFTAGLENLRIVVRDSDGDFVEFIDPSAVTRSVDVERTATSGPVTATALIEGQFRGGTIAGYVFDNDDDDDEIDPNEVLSGITVTLIDSDGNETEATTDADGIYTFADLWEGEYDVDVVNPANATSNPAIREGFQLHEMNTKGAVRSQPATTDIFPSLAGMSNSPADSDFEMIFQDTEMRLTVVDDAGAPLPNVTVRLLSCVFTGSAEGDDDGPDNVQGNGDDGTCASETLITTQTTDASGRVIFSDRSEGFWKLDPQEGTAGDGSGVAANPGFNFWVIRTLGEGDIEARTSTIEF